MMFNYEENITFTTPCNSCGTLFYSQNRYDEYECCYPCAVQLIDGDIKLGDV